MATVMIMIIITQVDFHYWRMGVENRHILPKVIYVFHCVCVCRPVDVRPASAQRHKHSIIKLNELHKLTHCDTTDNLRKTKRIPINRCENAKSVQRKLLFDQD